MNKLPIILLMLLTGAALAGCADNGNEAGAGGDIPAGTIQQAGSSTVFPIAEAWAEELAMLSGGQLQVTVAGGGSGRGASAICAGEIDIGDLSRPLKESEIENCRANGVDPVQWKVAYDGITVVVPTENSFIDYLTVEELEHIWRAENPARTWADVREGWPAQKIVLYGPDADSGTYEYFNEEILGDDCGPNGESICPPRNDYTASADDNVLVEGVSNSEFALGYFGFAYYQEATERLKAVPIQGEEQDTPVQPTMESIADGTYTPLARPIFMVTDGIPEEGTALHFYLEYAMNEGQELVETVGYVPLDEAVLQEQRAKL